MRSAIMSKTVKYFAYGSNLWSERIRIGNPTALANCAGLLKGYRLEFPYPTKRWKGFAANILPDPNSHVYGVVWDLNQDLTALDNQEGVADGIYERIELTVEDPSGEALKCVSYRITDATRNKSISEHSNPENRVPSRTYKNVLIRGAKENNLPSEYIIFLENIVDNGYDGEVEIKIPMN